MTKKKAATPQAREPRVTVKMPITQAQWRPILGRFKEHGIDAGPKAWECFQALYAELGANSTELAEDTPHEGSN